MQNKERRVKNMSSASEDGNLIWMASSQRTRPALKNDGIRRNLDNLEGTKSKVTVKQLKCIDLSEKIVFR